MKADPKAVAKLMAEAKAAKKLFADAEKQMESVSAARAAAVGQYANALAKLKLDGEIKESDFNNVAKADGILRKALVVEKKAHLSLDSSVEQATIAIGEVLIAQQQNEIGLKHHSIADVMKSGVSLTRTRGRNCMSAADVRWRSTKVVACCSQRAFTHGGAGRPRSSPPARCPPA